MEVDSTMHGCELDLGVCTTIVNLCFLLWVLMDLCLVWSGLSLIKLVLIVMARECSVWMIVGRVWG